VIHKKCEPIAARMQVIPVRPCAHSVMMRGTSGMFPDKFRRQPLHPMGFNKWIGHDDFLLLNASGRIERGFMSSGQLANARQGCPGT